MRIQKIIVTNCHAVTLSHQPYLAGDGHSSMLLLWGYRRASDNAQLSFRQKIFFGRGKFSNDHSLAKSPLATFSILSPCCLFLAPFSILSPCCLFLATFSTQSPCCLPLAPSTPSTLILLPPTITTCGSCVYTPSFLPLSPFRPPCSMNDENLFLFFLQTLLIQCRHSLLIFNILRAQNKLQRALLKNSF